MAVLQGAVCHCSHLPLVSLSFAHTELGVVIVAGYRGAVLAASQYALRGGVHRQSSAAFCGLSFATLPTGLVVSVT